MNLQPNYVKYSYPTSNYQNINDEIKETIDKLVIEFYNNLPSIKVQDIKYYLEITYDIKTYMDFITYILYISTYMGGAHPDNKVMTFTYDINKPVHINDVIGNKIEKVSEYIRKELLNRKDYIKEMVEEGITNNLNDYNRFYYNENGITFLFNPYQVAPYYLGIVEVTVPYSILEK